MIVGREFIFLYSYYSILATYLDNMVSKTSTN